MEKYNEDIQREQEDHMLGRFSDAMKESILVDPHAFNVFTSLMNGASPYQLLEELLRYNSVLKEQVHELSLGRPVQYVLKVEQKVIDEIKNNGIVTNVVKVPD